MFIGKEISTHRNISLGIHMQQWHPHAMITWTSAVGMGCKAGICQKMQNLFCKFQVDPVPDSGFHTAQAGNPQEYPGFLDERYYFFSALLSPLRRHHNNSCSLGKFSSIRSRQDLFRIQRQPVSHVSSKSKVKL